MIKFKDFKYRKNVTDVDNVNVQDGGGPQSTVAATASIEEQSVPKGWKLRDVEHHLKKAGFTEDRHSGGHKIFSHPTKGSISVPAHPTATISPGVVRKIFDVSESEDDQEKTIRYKPLKSFMKKATNIKPEGDKYPLGTPISGAGEIGVSG